MRTYEIACDACKGGGVDMTSRARCDEWHTACHVCKGYGSLIAKDMAQRTGVPEGTMRRVMKGEWRPRTLTQLDAVMNKLLEAVE